MKPLLYAVAVAGLMASSASFAQSSGGTNTAPSTTAGPGTTTGAGTTVGGTARSAANGAGNAAAQASNSATLNRNPAVATSSANDTMPAKGSNSFTMGEAKARLERNGFSNVSNLTKDSNGVWRGQAQKGGSATTVWLDYKGNTGTGQ